MCRDYTCSRIEKDTDKFSGSRRTLVRLNVRTGVACGIDYAVNTYITAVETRITVRNHN